MSNIDPKSLKVNQKVKFEDDHYWYVVRSVRHPFVICTTTSSKGYYTILDVDQNIRGEGTSWGLGHKTDEQVAESMLALHGEHPEGIEQEISRRNRVHLSIVRVNDFAPPVRHEH
jgi:hypothetical protein